MALYTQVGHKRIMVVEMKLVLRGGQILLPKPMIQSSADGVGTVGSRTYSSFMCSFVNNFQLC